MSRKPGRPLGRRSVDGVEDLVAELQLGFLHLRHGGSG